MRALIIIFFLFAGITNSYAQLYVKGYTGYSLSTTPDVLKKTVTINGNQNVWVDKVRIGQGMNIGIALGYKLTDNFAVELTGNTQLFSEGQFSNPEPNTNNISGSYYIFGTFGDYQFNTHLYQFSPQVVFSIDYKKLSLYMRGGPNFMKIKHNVKSDILFWALSGVVLEPLGHNLQYTDYGGIAVGVQIALGVEYPISKSTKFFFEVMNVNSHYRFREQETIYSIIDDVEEPGYPSRAPIDYKRGASHVTANFGIKYLFR